MKIYFLLMLLGIITIQTSISVAQDPSVMERQSGRENIQKLAGFCEVTRQRHEAMVRVECTSTETCIRNEGGESGCDLSFVAKRGLLLAKFGREEDSYFMDDKEIGHSREHGRDCYETSDASFKICFVDNQYMDKTKGKPKDYQKLEYGQFLPSEITPQNITKLSSGQMIGQYQHWTYYYDVKFGSEKNERVCLAVGYFQSGSNLVLAAGVDGIKWISVTNPEWKSINAGARYDIAFQFDRNLGRSTGSARGIASDLGMGVRIGVDGKFVDWFAASRRLLFTYEGKEVDVFSLAGSRKALNAIERCAKRYFRSDPFEKRQKADNSDPFSKHDNLKVPIPNIQFEHGREEVVPDFGDYPVDSVKVGKSAKAILDNHSSALKSAILKAAQMQPNFSGHYVVNIISSGGSQGGIIFDRETGKADLLPMSAYDFEFRLDSRLFVQNPRNPENLCNYVKALGEIPEYMNTIYWLWDGSAFSMLREEKPHVDCN